MATAGYWGGDVDAVEAAPVDSVLDAAEYMKFKADYEKAWIEMHKAKEA